MVRTLVTIKKIRIINSPVARRIRRAGFVFGLEVGHCRQAVLHEANFLVADLLDRHLMGFSSLSLATGSLALGGRAVPEMRRRASLYKSRHLTRSLEPGFLAKRSVFSIYISFTQILKPSRCL